MKTLKLNGTKVSLQSRHSDSTAWVQACANEVAPMIALAFKSKLSTFQNKELKNIVWSVGFCSTRNRSVNPQPVEVLLNVKRNTHKVSLASHVSNEIEACINVIVGMARVGFGVDLVKDSSTPTEFRGVKIQGYAKLLQFFGLDTTTVTNPQSTGKFEELLSDTLEGLGQFPHKAFKLDSVKTDGSRAMLSGHCQKCKKEVGIRNAFKAYVTQGKYTQYGAPLCPKHKTAVHFPTAQ